MSALLPQPTPGEGPGGGQRLPSVILPHLISFIWQAPAAVGKTFTTGCGDAKAASRAIDQEEEEGRIPSKAGTQQVHTNPVNAEIRAWDSMYMHQHIRVILCLL